MAETFRPQVGAYLDYGSWVISTSIRRDSGEEWIYWNRGLRWLRPANASRLFLPEGLLTLDDFSTDQLAKLRSSRNISEWAETEANF
jgi:hypothetical protein